MDRWARPPVGLSKRTQEIASKRCRIQLSSDRRAARTQGRNHDPHEPESAVSGGRPVVEAPSRSKNSGARIAIADAIRRARYSQLGDGNDRTENRPIKPKRSSSGQYCAQRKVKTSRASFTVKPLFNTVSARKRRQRANGAGDTVTASRRGGASWPQSKCRAHPPRGKVRCVGPVRARSHPHRSCRSPSAGSRSLSCRHRRRQLESTPRCL